MKTTFASLVMSLGLSANGDISVLVNWNLLTSTGTKFVVPKIMSRGHYPRVFSNTESLKIERWTGCEWKLKHLPESPARRYCRH